MGIKSANLISNYSDGGPSLVSNRNDLPFGEKESIAEESITRTKFDQVGEGNLIRKGYGRLWIEQGFGNTNLECSLGPVVRAA